MADTTTAETPMVTTEQTNPTQEPTKPSHVSFSIWPPTQRTREAVTTRLIETLSTPSILSKRYGTMGAEEAGEAARRIEEEAYEAAGKGNGGEGEVDGMEILQAYSKEISKRMLSAVKSRSEGDVVDGNEADKKEEVKEEKVVQEEGNGVVENEG